MYYTTGCGRKYMLRYIGKGFLVGVPSRDLTDVEAAMYGRARLLDSGLYIEVAPARKARKIQSENVTHSGQEPEEE